MDKEVADAIAKAKAIMEETPNAFIPQHTRGTHERLQSLLHADSPAVNREKIVTGNTVPRAKCARLRRRLQENAVGKIDLSIRRHPLGRKGR